MRPPAGAALRMRTAAVTRWPRRSQLIFATVGTSVIVAPSLLDGVIVRPTVRRMPSKSVVIFSRRLTQRPELSKRLEECRRWTHGVVLPLAW